MIRKFSASNYHLLNSNLRSLVLSQRVTRLHSSAHYNQSQTILLNLWMQRPIRGFRWVQGARSLTEFSSETTTCRSAYDVRYPFHNSNSFSNYNGSFWDGSLDKEIIMFFDKVILDYLLILWIWLHIWRGLSLFFFVHLFTHKKGQMTPVTIGYKTIDNVHEKCILQNGFSKV